MDEDTENEVENDAELTETCLETIQETSGTDELCTSRKTSRTAKKKLKHTKLEKNAKTKVSKEREKLNTIDGDKELKLDKKLTILWIVQMMSMKLRV